MLLAGPRGSCWGGQDNWILETLMARRPESAAMCFLAYPSCTPWMLGDAEKSSGGISQSWDCESEVTYCWKSEQTYGKQETRVKYQRSPGMRGRGNSFGKNTLSSRRAKPVVCGTLRESWASPAPSPTGAPLEESGNLEACAEVQILCVLLMRLSPHLQN